MTYDTIIAGLGAMGSAATSHLAARGRRVLGLERYSPAHEWGSSHGRSRIIRQAYYESPNYVPLLLRAYELWKELEQKTGRKLFTQTGALMLGSSESELFCGSLRSAREHDLPHEVLEAGEIEHRFPALAPAPGTLALYEERAGFVAPEEGVLAHLQMASSAGADLHFEEPVISWEEREEKVRVRTAKGSYEAEYLVLAPGAWARDLIGGPDLPLEVERQVMFWFSTPHVEGLPVFMWEPEDGHLFYGIPEAPGRVKVAFHHAGSPCTPQSIDREVHKEEVEAIRGYLGRYAPSLEGSLLEASTCMYTNTPDLHFVVGEHPECRRVLLACGFSGHGYKFSGVIGEVLADLVTGGRTEHPVDFFSPVRLLMDRA